MPTLIDLNNSVFDSLGGGIILLRPSGVVFNVQAAGTSCRQMTAEGILVPLPWELCDEIGMAAVQDRVRFSRQDAANVQMTCNELALPFEAGTDPDSLAGSMEAWVLGKIRLNPNADDKWGPGGMFPPELDGHPAVLFWGNSD